MRRSLLVRMADNGQGGFILAVVLVFIIISAIAGASFLQMAATEGIQASQNALPDKTTYLADAGCEVGKAWLYVQGSPPMTLSPITIATDVVLGDGTYSSVITPDPNNNINYLKKFTITGTGKVKYTGQTTVRASKSVTAVLQVESFCRYAYLTDNEVASGVIYFITGDRITGPARSNSQISISGSPIFQALVMSTASSFNYAHGGPPSDNPNFMQGYQLNAPALSFNTLQNLTQLASAATSGGLNLGTVKTAEITFVSDGTIKYRTIPSNKTSYGSYVTRSLPANGVIYIDGDAIVSGTVKGRCTLAVSSGNDIQIPSDIVYHIDPTLPTCTDVLGLVSGGGIIVTKSSPAGSDLNINASMIAFGTSFNVQNYSSISVMGALNVTGGIIQEQRGAVGTFSGSTRNHGYAKNYIFDQRLATSAPPFFPTTGKYEILSWTEGGTAFGR